MQHLAEHDDHDSRLVDGGADAVERSSEGSLRPRGFDELVGQTELVDNLRVFVAAAKARNEALDHVLLAGPPGLGKTTIAHIIARELGAELHVTSGPALERKDLAGIVSHLQEGDVLFIDEIHRLPAVVEENLYPAMEDFKFDLILGSGPHARTIEMPLPRFTLVGATTRTGLLTGQCATALVLRRACATTMWIPCARLFRAQRDCSIWTVLLKAR